MLCLWRRRRQPDQTETTAHTMAGRRVPQRARLEDSEPEARAEGKVKVLTRGPCITGNQTHPGGLSRPESPGRRRRSEWNCLGSDA